MNGAEIPCVKPVPPSEPKLSKDSVLLHYFYYAHCFSVLNVGKCLHIFNFTFPSKALCRY